MNKTYEAPTIECMHAHAPHNPLGERKERAARVIESIDGLSVEDLAQQFGSPCFVFSERTLIDNYQTIHQAFASRYANVQFGWSYKTNYLQAICQVFHAQGSLAEVVSPMEYEKARSLGIPGNQIIFNGPNKTYAGLKRAIEEGAQIHVDNYDEIQDIHSIADELNQTVRVGIRLSLDAGIYPQWSRFGFPLEDGQARQAVDELLKNKHIELHALHCHIGTYILDPEAYARQATKMIRFGYEIEDAYKFRIDCIDLGGGMPSPARLKGVYQAPEITNPEPDVYAEAICNAFQRELRPGHLPKMILEYGRAMVDTAGTLLTSVVARKNGPAGERAYVVDAGVNLLYTATWYEFDIATSCHVHGSPAASILYGPLCMNIDIVSNHCSLPPLERKQLLVIPNTGAYNVTQSMQFIEYRPAVIMIRENGYTQTIRSAEDLSDLHARELRLASSL